VNQAVIRSALWILAFWLSLPAYSQATFQDRFPSSTASAVALQCARLKEAPDDPASVLCLIRLSSFMHGWHLGVSQGAAATFLHDPKARASTEGAADMQNRHSSVLQKGRCATRAVDIGKLAAELRDYLVRNPQRSPERYDEVLVDVITSAYCR
jgi:hypothetical protein